MSLGEVPNIDMLLEIFEGPKANYKEEHVTSITKAKQQGFSIERSTDTTLLLDIDTLDKVEQYNEMLPKCQELFPGLVEEEHWPSKSGNSHVRLRLGCAMEPYKRIALQAILGDDPKRAAHNLNRIDNGEDAAQAIVLFRPSVEMTAQLVAEDKNGILQ